MENKLKLGVIPSYTQLSNAITTDRAPASILLAEKRPKDDHQKYYDFSYAAGLLNTGLQAVAGMAIMGLALFGKKKPGKHKIENLFTGKSANVYKMASAALGAGYLVGFPAVTGAGIKAEQPGMVLASLTWASVIPFMLKGMGVRARALLAMGYAPAFAGFANQINNEFGDNKGKTPRKMNMDFLFDKEGYTIEKLKDFAKFCAADQVIAIKTVGTTFKRLFNGDTSMFSTKPSKESMSLGSILILAGAVPKFISGKNINKRGEFIVDILIGAGLFFESLGMMSLANTKEDSRREAMLIGGPMRIIGDFGHENPFLFGMRTLGGSAFEYYWTAMNKEEKK